MAVTKIWPVHDSLSRVVDYCNNPEKTRTEGLEKALRYAADEAKTRRDGEESYAVTGINCRAESAAAEMAAVQKRFGKSGGNVAYHAYQSFKPGEVGAAQCHELGVALAKRLWGKDYQVLVATHYNTGTYHNHFIVNAVNMWNGKKLAAKYETYRLLREESDRLCREKGLSTLEDPQRRKTARSTYFAEKNGEPTRFNLLRQALDKALTLTDTWRDLQQVLLKMGYALDYSPYRKYATIRSLGSEKGVRTFRLGPAYEKEAIQERLRANDWNREVRAGFYRFMYPSLDERKRREEETEQERLRRYMREAERMSGIDLLLRIFMMILGRDPYPDKQFRKPLSPECREACQRLDRYSAEVTLAVQEKLKTVEDLQRFIGEREQEIREITAAREKMRNKQRSCRNPEEMARLKESCSRSSKALEQLRRQRKTALNIIEDHPEIQRMIGAEQRVRILADPTLSEKERKTLLGEADRRHQAQRER